MRKNLNPSKGGQALTQENETPVGAARHGSRFFRLFAQVVTVHLISFPLFFLSVSHSQAEEVMVEYRVLGESVAAEIVTQSLEVFITNHGLSQMQSTSAEISVAGSMPIGPLGQVGLGNIPPGITAAGFTDISFSLADEPIVRSTASLLFTLAFLDGAGQQAKVFVVGKQIP